MGCIAAFGCSASPRPASREPRPEAVIALSPSETLSYHPNAYVVRRAPSPITIDGSLTDPAWRTANWTADFVDIRGGAWPAPRFRTRAAMLWDSTTLYVAAELEEPELWATLTERDAVIYHDDDFEVFIDQDGDTHLYEELEVNALGTPWDLFLVRPYRDGGPALHGWDIAGLRVATHMAGTLNHAADRDTGWTVEIAIPLARLREAEGYREGPRAGDVWRMNFSRVEWRVAVDSSGRYVKRAGPEDNWVWSPQGAVDMHRPERWGYVLLAGSDTTFTRPADEGARWALRQLYYRQRHYREAHGRYASRLAELGPMPLAGVELKATQSGYEITAPSPIGTVHITQTGRVWTTTP